MKDQTVSRSSLICFKHFAETDYNIRSGKWTLKKGAVPNQFSSQSLECSENVEASNSNQNIKSDDKKVCRFSENQIFSLEQKNHLEKELAYWKKRAERLEKKVDVAELKIKQNEISLLSAVITVYRIVD